MTTNQTATKLGLAIKERKIAALSDELHDAAQEQIRLTGEIRDLLADYVAVTRKIIEELTNE